MYLFDQEGKLKDVNIEDILCIKREVVQRKTLFNTGSEYLHNPNTIAQLAQAFQSHGFYQIDKNKLFNLNKVDEYKDGCIYANGNKYLVSRRLKPKIQDILDQL